MSITKEDVLAKLQELSQMHLRYNRTDQPIGMDTLALYFNIDIPDITLLTGMLEAEGLISIQPVRQHNRSRNLQPSNRTLTLVD